MAPSPTPPEPQLWLGFSSFVAFSESRASMKGSERRKLSRLAHQRGRLVFPTSQSWASIVATQSRIYYGSTHVFSRTPPVYVSWILRSRFRNRTQGSLAYAVRRIRFPHYRIHVCDVLRKPACDLGFQAFVRYYYSSSKCGKPPWWPRVSEDLPKFGPPMDIILLPLPSVPRTPCAEAVPGTNLHLLILLRRWSGAGVIREQVGFPRDDADRRI